MAISSREEVRACVPRLVSQTCGEVPHVGSDWSSDLGKTESTFHECLECD